MEITVQGETTTVAVSNRIFKITYSQRHRRHQIRENRRLVSEASSFQEALNTVDRLVDQ